MNPIIKIDGVSKSFSGVVVLKDVSMELMPGEILGLIGENGAGKSTLMKIIGGIYTKDSGALYFDGEKIDITSPKEAMDYGIQIIHQEFSLVPHLSVAENIFVGNYPMKGGLVDRRTMREMAKKILSSIKADIPPEKMVAGLTVAEQQLVEIAKAISKNPKVLIMDEPTAALNDQETENLFSIIREMKSNGMAVIIITHRINEQLALSDRIIVLRDGCIVGNVETAKTDSDTIVSMMIGHDLSEMYSREYLPAGGVILETRNLCVGSKAKNINICLRCGEIVSVYGLMGMGQKELCNALVGYTKEKVTGKILIDGNEIRISSPEIAKKAGIGIVSDDRRKEGIVAVMSVKENTSISILDRLKGILGIVDRKTEVEQTTEWVNKLKVKCSGLNQKIKFLSGGNQQKVLIARWLINSTRILILNMPTRGIDVGAKAEIYSILDDLCKNGVAVFVFSYEMPEVLGISDRIYVMCDGEVTAEYSHEEADQEKLMKSSIINYITEG